MAKVTVDSVLKEAAAKLGSAVVERERTDIRARLVADPVIASHPENLDTAVRAELGQRLYDRLRAMEKEEKEREEAFLATCRAMNGKQWEERHTEVVDWSYKALTGRNEHFADAVKSAGITPQIARNVLLATDEFVLNEIEAYFEDRETGLMDWQYLFEYVRFLKGALKKHGIEPSALPQNAIRAMKPFVCTFVSAVVNYDRAHDPEKFGDYDECFLEFDDKWDKVEFALGEDPFDKAAELAEAHPVTLLNERTGERSVILVASLAFHLQRTMGEAPILLPTERVGMLLGRRGEAARQAGSRVIRALRKSGLLEETKSDWNHRRGEAKEYRFLIQSADYTPPKGYVTQFS